MNFDPRTLLFSLILSNTLMALSLFFAASNRGGRRDGIGKWTAALMFETLAWVLIASRGNIPEVLSVVVANGLIAAAHSLILAAIFEFQQRRLPHWTYLLPVSLTLVMAFTLLDDINARFIWGGLIYSFQMLLIARALLSDGVARAGRSWRLLLGGVVLMLLVLMLRAASALAVHVQFAQPQNATELEPVQVLSFIAVMAASLLGSIGFVLMLKERTDQEIMHLAMTDSLTRIPTGAR